MIFFIVLLACLLHIYIYIGDANWTQWTWGLSCASSLNFVLFSILGNWGLSCASSLNFVLSFQAAEIGGCQVPISIWSFTLRWVKLERNPSLSLTTFSCLPFSPSHFTCHRRLAYITTPRHLLQPISFQSIKLILLHLTLLTSYSDRNGIYVDMESPPIMFVEM